MPDHCLPSPNPDRRPAKRIRAITTVAALGIVLGSCDAAAQPAQPEAASGFAERRAVQARHAMAATANPHATRAAIDILRRGGNALDAAIAAQMVLTLVEPQSSGIGGGAFLLYRDARTGRLVAFDGRETAPADADERLFLGADGKPLAFYDAVVGGRSVGVPGAVRMLEAAHARHGRLPWAVLFQPAIRLARDGFPVSARLHNQIGLDKHLKRDPAAAAYFFDTRGEPHPVGHRLRNPALAETLQAIARRGSLALHTGPIARDIVAAVRDHPTNPGRLGERDLAFYRPIVRDALCVPWRRMLICGMPPPSSGGIAVAQIVSLFGHDPAARLTDASGALEADGVHRFAEAGRLAFADRNRYVADPAFVDWPRGLLAPAYLARRASRIGERSIGRAEPGEPADARQAGGESLSFERPATSHLSIVDRQGNLLSMTTTIEDSFGARLMVRGFLLNNQLTDFSLQPVEAGGPVANRVQPGKRPRSSMAPTLVFERNRDGRRGAWLLATGSPGGSQIINYVAQTLVATLIDGRDIQQAISLPHAGSRNGPTELEAGRVAPGLEQQLRGRGHEVRLIDMTSGLQGIRRVCDAARGCRLVGGTDPRREGTVEGY